MDQNAFKNEICLCFYIIFIDCEYSIKIFDIFKQISHMFFIKYILTINIISKHRKYFIEGWEEGEWRKMVQRTLNMSC